MVATANPHYDTIELVTELHETLLKTTSEKFQVLRVRGAESLSGLYEYNIWIRTFAETPVPLDKLINQPFSLKITPHDHTAIRYISGIAAEVQSYGHELPDALSPWSEHLAKVAPHTQFFELTLTPKIAFAQYGSRRKIWQNKTPSDIVNSILKEQIGLSPSDYQIKVNTPLWTSKDVMPFVVQYDESDFAFLSRLLERFGVFYYFQHGEQNTKIIFSDKESEFSTHSLPWQGQYVTDGTALIRHWRTQVSARGVKAFQLYDYNPELPEKTFDAQAKTQQKAARVYGATQEIYADSACRAENALSQMAESYLSANDNQAQLVNASANSPLVFPGNIYKFTEQHQHANIPAAALKQNHLVISAQIDWNLHDSIVTPHHQGFKLNCHFTALSGSTETFKVKPNLLTPTPKLAGIFRAEVLGKGSTPIDTIEEQGNQTNRFRARLQWDHGTDQDHTCYLWGTPFGNLRDGVNITVSFPDGSPYQIPVFNTIVTDYKTQTANETPDETLFMAASGQTTRGEGYNYLLMDDKTDQQKVQLYTHKDFEKIVELGDADILIKKGNYTIKVEEKNILIEAVKGDISLKCGGDLTLDAKGEIRMTAGKTISLDTVQNIVMDAKNLDITASLAIEQTAGTSWLAKGKTQANLDGGAGVKVSGMAVSIDATTLAAKSSLTNFS